MSDIVRQLIRVDSVFTKGVQRLIITEKIKDLATGKFEKVNTFVKDPKFHFYFSKEGHEQPIPVTSLPIDHVERIDCKYKDLLDVIAGLTGQEKRLDKLRNGNDKRQLNRMHDHYDLHMTDSNIEDYHMQEYQLKHKHEIQPLPISKGFMDIEVDIMNYEGFPNPDEAPCPVNFISYVNRDEQSLKLYVLLDPTNTSQENFIAENHNGTYLWTSDDCEWAKAALDEHFQDSVRPQCSLKFFSVEFFEEELDLITAFYQDVHVDKLDVLGAWNAYFDFKTIEMRLVQLGVNPSDIMCPPEFPFKKVALREDNFSADIADKSHTLNISGHCHNVDLLYYYAAVRKGRGKKESMKLGDILLEEIGESKFELKGTIQNGAHVDFENFLLYSSFDSYRLLQMEEKNKDIDLLFNMSLFTNTRLDKVMRKTVSIRNLAVKQFMSSGYVLSNNPNKFIEHEDLGKFQGAFVADAKLIARVGMEFNGELSSNIFEDGIDEDFSSLYPNIIMAYNMDGNTLIGLIQCEDEPEVHNHFGEIVSTGDIIHMGVKLLNLPSIEDALNDIEQLLEDEAA